MTAPRILVWGELLWDLFPPDQGGAQLGGAPANVAWHLAMIGARVTLVSRVGDDPRGHLARDKLAARGVDVSLVQIDPDRATGEVRISVEAGEPKYKLVPGRAWERIAFDDPVRAALPDARAIVFGSLSQRTDDGFASWRELIAARPPSCLRVCDVNLRPGHLDQRAAHAALAVADVIKINDAEVAALGAAVTAAPSDSMTRGGGDLRAGRAQLLAITHGPDGATLIARDQTIELAGVRARAGGDNVGCGDAWLAVLVHGLTQGWPLARTGAIASRWAAEVASHRGATPDFPADLISSMLGAP